MSRFFATSTALAAAVALTIASTVTAAASPATSEAPELVVVLDSSGSMAETDAGNGQTRMDAAKQAVTDLATSTPDTTRIGLRTYGDGVDSQAPGSCEDTTLRVPVGPVDRDALTTQVDDLTPRGDTPIGTALLAAATDFTGTGPQSVVLVSDGEPTCDPDPCPVAAQLADQGIDLRIDVIGLLVDDAARDVLQCIADAGNGTYVDATDAAELTTALDTSARRSFRGYVTTGEPVEGTPTSEGAPTVGPGQYLDTIPVSGTNHYLVDLPPGQSLHVGATIVRAPGAERGGVSGFLIMATYDPLTGDRCFLEQGGTAVGPTPLTGALLHGPSDEVGGGLDAGCDGVGTVLLEVDWRSAGSEGDDHPLELLIQTEDAVRGAPAEVTPVADRDEVYPALEPVEPSGTVQGSGDFATAPLLTPGAYEDGLRKGETSYYAIEVGWGQQLAVRADFPESADGSELDQLLGRQTITNLAVYNPVRKSVAPFGDSSSPLEFVDRNGGSLWSTTHPVAWTNRGETVYPEQRHVARPGTYYVQLTVQRDSTSSDELAGTIPVQLTVDLLGEETAGPDYATTSEVDEPSSSTQASTPASASPAAEPTAVDPSEPAQLEAAAASADSGLGALLPVLVGVAALLLIVLVGLMAFGVVSTRRRPTGEG
ncbi:VWA domain-containing protein [Jannaschia sp. R86511]|uniref:VWA domain-containing protein n=1 Tax=Jannaschia sp. R86511 TaxID=3093853 RepID=UPI0036D2C121